MKTTRDKVRFILLNLVVLDIILSTGCLFFPEWWTRIMHGGVYTDPLGMIRRLGAVWAAFVVLQLVALFRWELEPHWLVLIVGVRWTELFSDWFYWYFAERLTWFGHLGLLISPPANLLVGLYLFSVVRQKKYSTEPAHRR